jgi:subtilase family serine protease
MSIPVPSRSKIAAHLLAIALFAAVADHSAYSQAVPQVTSAIDSRSYSPLKGSVHALVRNGAKDLGVVPDDTPTGTLTLLLQRPAAQEQQLEQYLREVHTPGSPNYHKWITPQQFGNTYGVADSDLSAVQSWLESQGLKIEKVSSSKNTIEFSGTAGLVGKAFHTSLHAFLVNGETHHANATELQVPTALKPVIGAIFIPGRRLTCWVKRNSTPRTTS